MTLDTRFNPLKQPIVFICGSADASEWMIDRARMVVRNANRAGYYIVVGDDYGVDFAVGSECIDNVANWACLGLGRAPKNRVLTARSIFYFEMSHPIGLPSRKLHEWLDLEMVRMSNRVCCIWNGICNDVSLYEEARRRAKLAQLIEEPRVEINENGERRQQ